VSDTVAGTAYGGTDTRGVDTTEDTGESVAEVDMVFRSWCAGAPEEEAVLREAKMNYDQPGRNSGRLHLTPANPALQ